MRACLLPIAIAAATAGCDPPPPAAPRPAPASDRCALDAEPEVLRAEGAAALLRWEVDDRAVFTSETLPDDAAYRDYRRAVAAAGADVRRPPFVLEAHAGIDPAVVEREAHNVAAVFERGAGVVRPVRCLETIFFARQHARFSQLAHPTEMIVLVLRRGDRVRFYAGASDALFPPKWSYGFDEARADVAAGWRLDVALHNHTIVARGDGFVLGQPTLSTADVDVLRGLAEDAGLRSAWVTNGVYTVEVPAENFARFHGR